MTPRLRAAMLAHGFALAVIVSGVVLAARWPDAYHELVQEDELLEWSTFWSFVLAGTLHVRLARRRRGALVSRRGIVTCWFSLGVALLCWLVALEEISWGQRVLGFRPPEYFLEHNYQQELNVHNILATHVRKLGVASAILGYGVLLPLTPLVRAARRWLVRIRLTPAPIELVPLFGVTFALLMTYPVRFTGEWIELLFGLGVLFAPVVRAAKRRGARPPRHGPLRPVLLLAGSIALLGVASAAWSRHLRLVSPATVEAARVELAALAADLETVELPARSGGHRRLYSFVSDYRWDEPSRGKYWSLTRGGLPEERALYGLDPWNGPYWLGYERGRKGRCRLLIYSFGPNRMRETVKWELGGDDLGVAFDRACDRPD